MSAKRFYAETALVVDVWYVALRCSPSVGRLTGMIDGRVCFGVQWEIVLLIQGLSQPESNSLPERSHKSGK